jgi:hypothetical protein
MMPSSASERVLSRAWCAAMSVIPAVRRAPIGALRRAAMTFWSGAGTDFGSVFVIGDVADPMDGVLDRPVAADPGGQLFWFGLVNA